jgi:hypothetical protein
MNDNTSPTKMHELALALETAAEKLVRGKPPTPGLLLKAANVLHEAAEELRHPKATP